MQTQRIDFGNNWISISTAKEDERTSGIIHSNLCPEDTAEDEDFAQCVDGMQSLLLAMACEGVDITDPRIVRAVETTVEAISNNT